MSRIKSKNTKPELLVRRLVTALGLGYRLHAKDLPGKPDLIFRGRRKVVFVHGCFWHQHVNCRAGRVPASNAAYWSDKLQRNVARDARVMSELRRDGWDVIVVWQCETLDVEALTARLGQLFSDRFSLPEQGAAIVSKSRKGVAKPLGVG